MNEKKFINYISAKINNVALRLDVQPLTGDEVEAAHRLPPKPGIVLAVIVMFSKQATRNLWLNNRTKINRLGTVHLLENVTKENSALLWSTEAWAN